MLGLFFILLVVGLAIFLQLTLRKKEKPVLPVQDKVVEVLQKKVAYYNRLSITEQQRFQNEVSAFLQQVKITGVGTSVSDEDRILVAASGIIPIFAFRGWKYPNLNEVLLYPDRFSHDFDFNESNEDRNILGMVGSGGLNKIMILSKPALYNGFSNRTDTNNTALHEFVHLLDKADGDVDGLPAWLIDKDNAKPWLHLIHQNIQAIKENNSDIDPYGATSEAEFFAVASEYFFENPLLFKENHPDLYNMLEKIFRQDPGSNDNRLLAIDDKQ